MRSTLAGREDGIIHALLEILRILEVFPEENETSTRSTEGFVSKADSLSEIKERGFLVNSRCGRDDITVIERIVQLLGSDEATGMGNIGHQPCTLLLASLF